MKIGSNAKAFGFSMRLKAKFKRDRRIKTIPSKYWRRKMKETIYHLLKPKEFRTWCMPNRAPSSEMNVTALPSKASCVNCLTAFRRSTGGKMFRKKWTDRSDPEPREPKLEE